MSPLFDTLTAALASLGCDTQRFVFDTHSPIVMEFADIGELLLDPENGQLALWGRLPTCAQLGFGGRADELLGLLSAAAGYMANGCLALRDLEEQCAVGGLLHADCLADPARMAEAIESIHARVAQLQGLLQ